MKNSEKLETIRANIQGTWEEIAMMVPCHVQTLYNIKYDKPLKHEGIVNGLNKLYEKAVKIEKVMQE